MVLKLNSGFALEQAERLLADMAGKREIRLKQEHKDAIRSAIELIQKNRSIDGGEIKSWKQAIPDKGVVLIFGHRGKGKSACGWMIADMKRQQRGGRKVYVLGMPKNKRRYAPKWAKHCDNINKLPKGVIVIVDEAALRFPARRSQSSSNMALTGLNALSRQRDQLIIFIAHNARLLEIEAVMDCDVIIYRKPSAAHLKFERRETADWSINARQAIMMQKNPLHWAYVVDLEDGRSGLLRCKLPPFWNEDLSKAWADLDVQELIDAMNGIDTEDEKQGKE